MLQRARHQRRDEISLLVTGTHEALELGLDVGERRRCLSAVHINFGSDVVTELFRSLERSGVRKHRKCPYLARHRVAVGLRHSVKPSFDPFGDQTRSRIVCPSSASEQIVSERGQLLVGSERVELVLRHRHGVAEFDEQKAKEALPRPETEPPDR